MSSAPDGSPISPLLTSLWRRSQPTQTELARAHSRFQRRNAAERRPGARHVIVWMGAGMLVGMGSLYAAETVHNRWQRAEPPFQSAVSHLPVSVPSLRTPAPGSTSSEPAPSTRAAPPAAGGSSAAVTEVAAPTEATSPESWQRAARGLRESDFEAANDALLKLSRQGSQAERDIAKLVRAQVLLRQERAAEARVLLLELVSSTASATAREKSAKLLEQLPPAPSSHRSFEIDPGTDSP
jgi:hypothetical protein